MRKALFIMFLSTVYITGWVTMSAMKFKPLLDEHLTAGPAALGLLAAAVAWVGSSMVLMEFLGIVQSKSILTKEEFHEANDKLEEKVASRIWSRMGDYINKIEEQAKLNVDYRKQLAILKWHQFCTTYGCQARNQESMLRQTSNFDLSGVPIKPEEPPKTTDKKTPLKVFDTVTHKNFPSQSFRILELRKTIPSKNLPSRTIATCLHKEGPDDGPDYYFNVDSLEFDCR